MSRRTRHLTAVLAVAMALSLLSSAAAPSAQAAAHPRSSTRWRACSIRLDGIRTALHRTQRTVTIVNQTSRTYARVSFWVRTPSPCSLSRIFLTRSARIGYGGTVAFNRRRQGTGTTPLGTFSMTQAFGIGPAPRTLVPYHRVRSGDYWVDDNRSRFYNTLRNRSQGGFRYRLPKADLNSSEYLPHYGRQYRYAVVINFNRWPQPRVHYRGSGIFLHVSSRGATAGCVAITAAQLRTVLAYLKSGDRITIAR